MNFIENFFFREKKNKNKYWLINYTIKINAIIIKNTNVLLSIDKLFKNFTECIIFLLINFFSKYNQIKFVKKCRNFIDFITSLKLLKIIILSQNAINLIDQFIKIIIIILQIYIDKIKFFLNNFDIKNFKTKYIKKIFFENIKKFVAKYIWNIDKILTNIKKFEYIIFDTKF